MASPQTNALTAAQSLIGLMTQYINLMNGINQWITDYTQNNWANNWINMATATVNSDGSVAGTNDGSPNNAHPINLPTSNPILVSYTSLVNAKTLAVMLQTVYTQSGGTVAMSAQAAEVTAAVVAPNI